MPHVPLDPLVPPTYINDLGNAVARWEYEGGADVTGPQEGYRIDGRLVSKLIKRGTFSRVEKDAFDDRFDRLVRLSLAASAIRNRRQALGADVGNLKDKSVNGVHHRTDAFGCAP